MQANYGKKESGEWIEGRGVVVRLLADDNDEARHQRLILDVGRGQTLLIAHNLELAERVPVSLGDRIQFRGVYEYNDLGGLVHWTHDDPLGAEAGGYIRYRQRDFR